MQASYHFSSAIVSFNQGLYILVLQLANWIQLKHFIISFTVKEPGLSEVWQGIVMALDPTIVNSMKSFTRQTRTKFSDYSGYCFDII